METDKNEQDQKYRVILGGVLTSDVNTVAEKLAARFSADPQKMKRLLASPGHILKSGLSQSEANVYQAALQECGAHAFVEADNTLSIDLPKETESVAAPATETKDETLIRRIADYEQFSVIFWIILGVIQLFTVYLAIAGVWNIIMGIMRFPTIKKIRNRDASVPREFEPIWHLVVIGLVNLLFGGVVGIIFIAFDFFIRDKVLSNKKLFTHSASGTELQNQFQTMSDQERRADQARAFAEAKLAELKSRSR